MNSIFDYSDFEEKDYFPTEEDFKKISEAFQDVKTNGEDCKFNNDPMIIVRQSNTCNVISKKLIVCIILHWDELASKLKEKWKTMCQLSDLKKIIGLFISNINEYENIIDKYSIK